MEEKLIELVRLHEVLFNYEMASYRDKCVRQKAWEEIGKELHIQGEKAKDLWDKLRRCFCNAINRRRDKKNGQAAKKMIPWKFENQMSFLLPYFENRKAISNLNNAIVNEKHDRNVNIDLNDKTHYINEDSYQSTNNETEIILIEKESVDGIENLAQDIQNYNTSGTGKIKHFEIAEAPVNNLKRNKIINSNNNSTLQMLNIIKENTALREMKHEEKIIRPKVPTIFENMDETDIFFLSMSKMTKLLPKEEQANIKLLLSNCVLQAEVRNTSIQAVSQPITSPIPSEVATSSHYLTI